VKLKLKRNIRPDYHARKLETLRMIKYDVSHAKHVPYNTLRTDKSVTGKPVPEVLKTQDLKRILSLQTYKHEMCQSMTIRFAT